MGNVRQGASHMSFSAVVLDTNVFTAELNPRSPISRLYLKHLVGAKVAVAAQTVAEARYGALLAEWGQTRRLKLEMLIQRVHTWQLTTKPRGHSHGFALTATASATHCTKKTTSATYGSRPQPSDGAYP